MDTKMKTMNESYFCTWNVQGEVAQKNTKAKEAGEICPIASNPANIGVFGNFASITFKLNTAPTTVKMRNLITDDVIDISADLILDKNLRITDNVLYKMADPQKAEKLALQLMLSY